MLYLRIYYHFASTDFSDFGFTVIASLTHLLEVSEGENVANELYEVIQWSEFSFCFDLLMYIYVGNF